MYTILVRYVAAAAAAAAAPVETNSFVVSYPTGFLTGGFFGIMSEFSREKKPVKK